MPSSDVAPEPSAPEFDNNLFAQAMARHKQNWAEQGPQFAQQLDREDRTPTSGLDYLTDIPRGVGGGIEGFAKSVGGLANHVSEFFGGDDLFDKDVSTCGR